MRFGFISTMLHYLIFEETASDGHSLTWEAMASVPPARLPAVLDEAAHVMAWVTQYLGAPPCPLDDGGEWDALLEVQAEGGAPRCLPWVSNSGHIQPLLIPENTPWVTVTVTLVVCSAWADSFLAAWHSDVES